MRFYAQFRHAVALYDERAVFVFAEEFRAVNGSLDDFAEHVGGAFGGSVKEVHVVAVLNGAAAVAHDGVVGALHSVYFHFLIVVARAAEQCYNADAKRRYNCKKFFRHLHNSILPVTIL